MRHGTLFVVLFGVLCVGAFASDSASSNLELLIRQARSEEANQQWDSAIDKYKPLLRVNPNPALLCEDLGGVLSPRDQYPGAISSPRQAIQGAYAEAILRLKKAISKQPQALGLHYALGNAHEFFSQHSEVIHKFHSELELNPYDYRALSKTADCLLREDPSEALRLADNAPALQPNFSAALLVRGQAYLELKNPDCAVENFRKAGKLTSDDKISHYRLAKACKELGNTAQAEA